MHPTRLPATRLVSRELLAEVRAQFRLDWSGAHGFSHWARVYRHGLYVGRAIGADLRVVELFAFLHDSQRDNEYTDHGHGARAADYAQWLHRRGRFELEADALRLLMEACRDHTNGATIAHPTVMACWDADRLDLGRVNMVPDPARLCTEAARDRTYIERAWRRSQAHAQRMRCVRRAWHEAQDVVIRPGPS